MIFSFKKAFATCAMAFAAASFLASPAQAKPQDGLIQSGEFVFFFNSNCPNSVGISDFAVDKSDLAGYSFLGGGSWPGVGKPVKNNSACVHNLGVTGARVYFNSGYMGVSDYIAYGLTHNLTSTYNENASWRWAEGIAN